MEKNIIFIYGGAFPYGGAYINRILALCKGIIRNGSYARLLIIFPKKTEKFINNFQKKGIYEGVPFEHTIFNNKLPQNIIDRLYMRILGLMASIKKIIILNRKKRINSIIICTSNPFYVVPYYFLTRVYKILLIREKNEFPKSIIHKSRYSFLYSKILLFSLYKLFDGMIFITSNLQDFFKNKLNRKAKSIIIPIVVEPERFECNGAKINGEKKYVTYCGHLFGNKDGVDILLHAFANIHEDYENVLINLIGDISNNKEYSKLKGLISTLKIEDKVVFMGFINREQIPVSLCKAYVLVLARPDNIQAKGGFPTKLGEYLATGNPVIITSTGDIGKYLTDLKNAFIAKPGDVESFSNKLKFVLDNPVLANKVGRQGKRLAYKDFNYVHQAKRLLRFVESLQTSFRERKQRLK